MLVDAMTVILLLVAGKMVLKVDLPRPRLDLAAVIAEGFRHRYYRIVLVAMLALACGWLSQLAIVGWDGLGRQLRGEAPPPTTREIEYCHRVQEEYIYNRGQELPQCPARGRIVEDAEGLRCTRHGKVPTP